MQTGWTIGYHETIVAIGTIFMQIQQPRYSTEEIARHGRELYATQIRQQVEHDYHGKIVAIDVQTGEFAIGNNSLTASDLLLEKFPEAQIWFVRVGHRAVHRIGFAGSTLIQ